MRILVTNDDGIDAPGLAVLAQVAERFGEVLVVAPRDHQSGCSHMVTTHRPLTVEQRGEQRYAVDGTPADCVRVALRHLRLEVDWVLSGVNDGGNLGVDIYLSGTVAAAREARLLGKPAIAFSQYRRSKTVRWDRASVYAQAALADILDEPSCERSFWNVNFPDLEEDILPPIVAATWDPAPLPVQFVEVEGQPIFRSRYQERGRTPQHDVDVCFGGAISVTRLKHPNGSF